MTEKRYLLCGSCSRPVTNKVVTSIPQGTWVECPHCNIIVQFPDLNYPGRKWEENERTFTKTKCQMSDLSPHDRDSWNQYNDFLKSLRGYEESDDGI